MRMTYKKKGKPSNLLMTNGDAILRNTEAYINKCAESRL